VPEGVPSGPAARIAMAVATGGPLDAWSESLSGRDEPVSTEIVLVLETDSAGAVTRVEVASAPLVSTAIQHQIESVVGRMSFPDRRGYDGTVSFTWHYAPGEERRPSPLLVGALAGLTVGITALLLALLE
jgi:hypothetical protein